jgi:hypothetical protein
MRIQETDRILKEARSARHAAQLHAEHPNAVTRMWRKLTGIFKKDEH